jgi:hypothetical protein
MPCSERYQAALEQPEMKKLLFIGIATLFLTTGTAHANEAAIKACNEQFTVGGSSLRTIGNKICL